ncbi:hypothetical protein [Actinomadura atramentaria]|uniref:hypothetical protein n=1 Tax=Actinomadura atramentaria TaxID=1990 RepID=UPI000372A9DD|nr:hypothetical protein [Actinomadura atramentaria]
MPRKLPELSTTQLIASGVATLGAAVGASYLGVYGTIGGAAFMSVASTAGGIVAKHYLDQGKEQIRERAHLMSSAVSRDEVERAAAEATSASPVRAGAPAHTPRRADDPNTINLDPNATLLDPGATRIDTPLPFGGDPGATRLDGSAAVAGDLAAEAGDAARRASWRTALGDTGAWARRHWGKLAASSAAVFVLVLGAISLYEVAAGAGIGRGGGQGPTVVRVFGGGTADKPAQHPTAPATDAPGETPSTTPPASPTPGTTAPSEQPTTTPPSERPTTTPPSSTPPSQTPSSPAETGGRQDGGAATPDE